MSTILHGSITISRRLREHLIWQRADYGWAWLDMLMLANNRDGTKCLNGEFIDIKRGQLLWSLRSLEREWNKSGEWLGGFLRFCQDHTMIKVTAKKNRGTVITILNYEAYNPQVAGSETVTDTDTVAGSETVTDTDTVAGSETVTTPEWNGERRTGNEKGEGARPPAKLDNTGFAEVPAEAEVLTFAEAYSGDLARAIPAHIPARWASDWYRYKVGSGQWPKKWREKMALDFRNDFVGGHPKAREGEKNTAVQTGGRTPAQVRFELSRELKEIRARLDACHENNVAPAPADKLREKELQKLLRAPGTGAAVNQQP